MSILVGREVEIIPGRNLLFTWRTKKQLYDFLEVRTQVQFATKFQEVAKNDGLDDEFLEKLFYLGLKWEDPDLRIEQVPDIMDAFCTEGKHGIDELFDKLIEALVNSGLLNKALIDAAKQLQRELTEAEVNKIVQQQKKTIRGPDRGNQESPIQIQPSEILT